MKLLLDTNIMLDFYAKRAPFYDDWMTLRVMQIYGDVELWASAKSYTDVFYVMKKFASPEAIQQSFVKSLDFINICSIDGDDIRTAAEEQWPDFEDCLVSVAAQKVKAEYLVTRDVKGFARSKVRALSPGELFRLFKDEYGLSYGVEELR